MVQVMEAQNIKVCFFLKIPFQVKLLNQIWLNFLVDHHHFG
jgi:hypothetical protein